MSGQQQHPYLVTGDHDQVNRQDFVTTLRQHILQDVGAGLRTAYDRRAKPAHEKRLGRPLEHHRDVRDAMNADPYSALYTAMNRICQEMMWGSVQDAVQEAQPDLNARIGQVQSKYGSLTLDPDLDLPAHQQVADFHSMPGNYHAEWIDGDVSQAALFDRGLYIYQGGFAGPLCDGTGRTEAELIKRRWPDFKPEKILDLGCTLGNNTLPYADVFPDAEVHAIDVAAPCVRYGHARAEALGVPIHFHQMNAEAMTFDDESFDLIVSCILFHETAPTAVRQIVKECHRVLKPGGLMLHLETPRSFDLDIYDAYCLNWDSYNNDEPFQEAWTGTDMRTVCQDAGFDEDKLEYVVIPDLVCVSEEDFDKAAKGDMRADTGAIHWGETINWHLYGAWK